MNLKDFSRYIIEALDGNISKADRINLRMPYIGEGVPMTSRNGIVFIYLEGVIWTTEGTKGKRGELYVPARCLINPKEHWVPIEDDDLANEVIDEDGRVFGPCEHDGCGELTSRRCGGEFTYWHGKRRVTDEVDLDCGNMACFLCRWCDDCTYQVLNVVDQFGGVPDTPMEPDADKMRRLGW